MSLDFPSSPAAGQIYDKWVWNGTAWVYIEGETPPQGIDYEPTITGITIGNAVRTHKYYISDGLVHCFDKFVFGSTTAVTGPIVMTQPIANAGDFPWMEGMAHTGATSGMAKISWRSQGQTSMMMLAHVASTPYVTMANASATIPITWVDGSIFWRWGAYRPDPEAI